MDTALLFVVALMLGNDVSRAIATALEIEPTKEEVALINATLSLEGSSHRLGINPLTGTVEHLTAYSAEAFFAKFS